MRPRAVVSASRQGRVDKSEKRGNTKKCKAKLKLKFRKCQCIIKSVSAAWRSSGKAKHIFALLLEREGSSWNSKLIMLLF